VENDTDEIELAADTSGTELATLDLPAGSYAIFARTMIAPGVHSPSTNGNFNADCRLIAGSDEDFVGVGQDYAQAPDNGELVELNLLHRFTSAGSATLRCFTTLGSGTVALRWRITAIQVSSIS